MTAYLGPLGNLVAFRCPSSEQIEQADNLSTEWTMAGVQKAQYGPLAPRSWQVGIGTATPEQVGRLTGLMRGLYGPPPWSYVGPWAQVTNVLTPAASLLLPGSWNGGGEAYTEAITLDDGSRPTSSVINDSGVTTFVSQVPVVPGIPVTGSGWGAGTTDFIVQLIFRSAAGADAGGSATRTFKAPLGPPLVRGSVTATPPAGAAYAELRFPRAIRVAQPALTWTPQVAPWMAGEGVAAVVPRGMSKAVQLAVRHQADMRRTALSFTLDEVGNA